MIKTTNPSNALPDATPRTPLLRIKQVVAPLGLLPMSRSTFLEGVRIGRFPPPIRFLPGRITAWRRVDIEQLASTGCWLPPSSDTSQQA